MSKFAMLFIGGTIPEDKREQNMNDWMEWHGKLQSSGSVVDAGAPFGNKSKVVSANGAKDYDWDKDSNVGGYLVVEAADVDVAVKLTEGCPGLDPVYGDGLVEVREIIQM